MYIPTSSLSKEYDRVLVLDMLAGVKEVATTYALSHQDVIYLFSLIVSSQN